MAYKATHFYDFFRIVHNLLNNLVVCYSGSYIIMKKQTVSPRITTLKCPYCGRKAEHKILKNVDTSDVGFLVPSGKATGYLTFLYLCRCSSCSEISLWQGYVYPDPRPEDEPLVLQWPLGEILSELPDEAAAAYLSARDLREEYPDLAAVSLRKALDFICLKFVSADLSLVEKIRDLSANNYLPPQLVEAAEALRTVGNVGAHESPSNVTSAEVWMLNSLFTLLAQYLFVLPAKIELLRSFREGRLWNNWIEK